MSVLLRLFRPFICGSIRKLHSDILVEKSLTRVYRESDMGTNIYRVQSIHLSIYIYVISKVGSKDIYKTKKKPDPLHAIYLQEGDKMRKKKTYMSEAASKYQLFYSVLYHVGHLVKHPRQSFVSKFYTEAVV